jgi:hypothetical protein
MLIPMAETPPPKASRENGAGDGLPILGAGDTKVTALPLLVPAGKAGFSTAEIVVCADRLAVAASSVSAKKK